jgi:hypothetical protein
MAQDHAAYNGEILGKKTIEITADGNGVARYVRDNRGETLDKGS